MNRITAATLAIAIAAGTASAQSFTETFDGASLLPTSWTSVNVSPNGLGSSPNWAQTPGSVGNWMPYAGAGYAAVGYNATTGAGDISVYLVSPELTFNNGDIISFWTRTWDSVFYPDRMSLVYNTDASTNPASFTNTLITVNPDLTTTGYPTVWTQYSVTVTGLAQPVNGRFAFHYNPTNGGPSGNNSDRVGIDEVIYSSVPTPGSIALLGLGGLLSARRRR